MSIFHCAGGKKKWRKFGVFISEKLQPDAGSRVNLRVRSVQTAGRDARVKVADRRVRSLAKPERPILHLVGSACLNADRTRWRVRSRVTGHVRSREELSGLRSDIGCSASSQTV
jgi:hypothetical protein